MYIKLNKIKLFILGIGLMLVACNTSSNSSELQEAIKELKDGQGVVLKKIASLEKAMNTIALASKNQPPKKNEPPKADPNKVYNIPIGDSYSKGPKDAAVTIIEWSDFQ